MVAAPSLGIHLSSLQNEGWEFEHCLSWASRLEIRFLEVGPEFPQACRNPSLARRQLDHYGIAFAAVEMGADWYAPLPGSVLELESALRWAYEAGCAQILLAGMEWDRPDDVYPKIAAAAERWGIVISIDLGGAAAGRTEELRESLEDIDSPWMRISIDTGRTRSAGQDPLALAAAFESRIGHFRIRTHPRDSVGASLTRSIVELLLDTGYDGELGILDESGRAPALAAAVKEVRRTLADAISRSMPAE